MFNSAAQVLDRAGNVLSEPACDVWRDAETPTDVGEQVAWRGIVTADSAAALVAQRNRLLVADGIEYRVEDAILHNILGYVEVRLLQVLADG